MKSFLFFSLFLLASTTLYAQKKLWYQQPATVWEEALPIGNGKLGAMVFGQTTTERIQLNEDSLWPGGYSDWGLATGTPDDLKQVRAFLLEGENKKADELFVSKFSRKSILRSHQTLGDLWMDLGYESVENYHRELDLEQAVVRVNYTVDGHEISQEIFSSQPDNAIIIQIKSSHPDGLNGRLRLSRPVDEVPTVRVEATHAKTLVMDGEVTQRKGVIDSGPAPILHGVRFQTIAAIENEGGEIKSEADFIAFKNVKTLLVKIVTNTSFYHDDFRGQNQKQLQKLRNETYEDLLQRHKADYQQFFNRVNLQLGDNQINDIPTDKRLGNVKSGEEDLFLESLLFDYGRYLLIASSRPGTLPANLQGIWNQHISAPWNADYHMNINLQMNYWPAEVTNLSELHDPLFDFVDGLVESGKKTARETYGMPGTVFGHSTDLWQPTFLNAATAYWGGWVGASAWMMQHYWQRYAYTLDKDFLENRLFPALEEVAKFYAAWLIEHPADGRLVSAPSTSPENSFVNVKGDTVATTIGAAMDQQLIAELFDNYLEAAKLLNKESATVSDIKDKRKNLRSGLEIGPDGRILEWDQPYVEPEKGHRHMSHLYAFHPSSQITKSKQPELFDAVKKTLEYRLEHGGAGTGWSRAWLINFAARLQDGEMAHEHVKKLLEISMYPNLFDAHPPFQIDGNFGYTAGIAEMLLQSHEVGVIHLFPALPNSWQSGKVTGLKARGNIEIGFEWDKGKLKTVSLISPIKQKITVRYLDEDRIVSLITNQEHRLSF